MELRWSKQDYIKGCSCFRCEDYRNKKEDAMGNYILDCYCHWCCKHRKEEGARMKKVKLPRMKRHVALETFEDQGVICFYANEEIAALAGDFGRVCMTLYNDKYELHVDARYDLDDVVEWLESLA